MGFEPEGAGACPLGFSASDSKMLADILVLDQLRDRIATALAVDLSPLGCVAGQERDLEDFLESQDDDPESRAEAERQWRESAAADEAAWQRPEGLRACLRRLLAALDSPGGLASLPASLREPPPPGSVAFPAPTLSETFGLPEEYFAAGAFRSDVSDLLRMVEWAIEQRAPRVRITVA